MTHAVRVALALLLTLPALAAKRPIEPEDYFRIQEVVDAEISPDGNWIAYVIEKNDRKLETYGQVYLMSTRDKITRLISDPAANDGSIRWKRDSSAFGFLSSKSGHTSIWMAQTSGRKQLLAQADNTNHVLPSTGYRLAWSPDGRQLAYVAADPPDPKESTDPIHITRYLYKFIAGRDDNRRSHIYILDVAAKRSRKLTDGPYYEHTVDWSPDGKEILFESNSGPLDELEFNYDIFAADAQTGKQRRLTNTRSQEYQAVWSSDGKWITYLGTKRDITCSETTMEDTHVWVIPASGGQGRELPGSLQLDRRALRPRWSADGRSVYFIAQDRGNVDLYKVLTEGSGAASQVTKQTGTVVSYSVANDGRIALAFRTPESPGELFLQAGESQAPQVLTQLNHQLLSEVEFSHPEEVNYKSVDGKPVQAWITPALQASANAGGSANQKYPLILTIHGGPHSMQGPAFNFKAQVYAAKGYSSMMINYRGSTGYGEKFSEGTYQNNDGTEWDDVNFGVDAAMAQKAYVDRLRLGIEGTSYGGQLTNWGITRTDRFKAAIPTAGISNFISYGFNSYYHDYYRVEYDSYPWEGDNYKTLWEHSPLAYVTRVKTPVLFIHGALDNDVPVNDSEQYYIALRENHVETEMLLYPREGHGLREPGHVVDAIQRSLAWYGEYIK